MARNEYRLRSEWRVPGAVREVYDVVSDAEALAHWWPSGFLLVEVVDQGDADGLGKVLDVLTKGWLPYTIRWRQRVARIEPPHGFTIEVSGDFDGYGVWAFSECDQGVIATFDWRIDADKPLLRYGSPLLRRVFSWNHRWVMARGEESLRLELRRRAASTPAERAAVPPPPCPTWPHRRRVARSGVTAGYSAPLRKPSTYPGICDQSPE